MVEVVGIFSDNLNVLKGTDPAACVSVTTEQQHLIETLGHLIATQAVDRCEPSLPIDITILSGHGQLLGALTQCKKKKGERPDIKVLERLFMSFQGYVRHNPCFRYNTSEQSACLIERLSVSLPRDPQELDLLGSQAIGNASAGWNQTCFCFGQSHQGLSARARILKQLWDYADNPFFDATGWTVVSPHNEQEFSVWGAYCGYSNQTGEGGNLRPWYGYGASFSEDDSQHALWNNDSAKALPPGVFLICGDRTWAGIPANVQGGPCYLGQLALFTPQHRQWLNVASGLHKARQRRSIRRLTPDCNDNVDLWSATARVFASVLTPGVAAAQALKQLENLACWSAKQANETTLVLTSMLSDMNSLRHALLQNRAAIDFLLLAQGHGCEDFEGMCCFNLSDHSQSIHEQLQWLKRHTQKIQIDKNPFDDWLKSLFGGLSPWLTALIKEGLRWLLLILVVLLHF